MNPFEYGLAFIEGLALIASPCILPVLPLVLSASVDGGKARPFGIITGFVLAFSLFALASKSLVNAFGVDPEILKTASLILLALFGLTLLSSSLSNAFSRMTQKVSALGAGIGQHGNQGFLSGIVIGVLIGLVWTPCAGPILASVLVQVIRQTGGMESLIILMFFSAGAAFPMLAIALMGRKILGKIGFITSRTEILRKCFGCIILLSVLVIASGFDFQSVLSTSSKNTNARKADRLEKPLASFYQAPEFVGVSNWINSKPLTMEDLKGKVVLVDFWTYSCINCIRTLPYLTAWDDKYKNQGLVIVGIHAPEFEFEKNPENVRKAVLQRSIHYPVALDNKLETWQNFNNRYWPAHYLINREGKVVYTHFGEGEYETTENNIRYLLGLRTSDSKSNIRAETPHTSGQTPETYLGYERADRFSGEIKKDMNKVYDYPFALKPDEWALHGSWIVEGQKIVAVTSGAALKMNFHARKVFLVLGSSHGNQIEARVTLNGYSATGGDIRDGKVKIGSHTLYELVRQDQPARGEIEITAESPGLEAYAFTFGG